MKLSKKHEQMVSNIAYVFMVIIGISLLIYTFEFSIKWILTFIGAWFLASAYKEWGYEKEKERLFAKYYTNLEEDK